MGWDERTRRWDSPAVPSVNAMTHYTERNTPYVDVLFVVSVMQVILNELLCGLIKILMLIK